MGKSKNELNRLSINQLSELTGKPYRTIKKKLESLEPIEVNANAILYDPRDALPLIYQIEKSEFDFGDTFDLNKSTLNPAVQNARLAKARADKVELEIKILEKTLVPVYQVEKTWSDFVLSTKSKLRILPGKVSNLLIGKTSYQEINLILEKYIDEALYELCEFNTDDRNSSIDSESSEEIRTSEEIDDESMG